MLHPTSAGIAGTVARMPPSRTPATPYSTPRTLPSSSRSHSSSRGGHLVGLGLGSVVRVRVRVGVRVRDRAKVRAMIRARVRVRCRVGEVARHHAHSAAAFSSCPFCRAVGGSNQHERSSSPLRVISSGTSSAKRSQHTSRPASTAYRGTASSSAHSSRSSHSSS